MPYEYLYFLAAFLISFGLSGWLVLRRDVFLRMANRRMDASAVQAAHSVPTPRVGGVAVLFSVVLIGTLMTAHDPGRIWMVAITLLPVFFAGLAEDLGFEVNPRRRLVAAGVSSLMCILLFGAWITRTDLPVMDFFVEITIVGVVFTVFAGAGICNAFNLIDGLNGLSSMIGITVAVALSIIAQQGAQPHIAMWGYVVACALVGFLVFNFPWGKIFMGDAGAYGIGHLLVWFAILLMHNVPQLSPWAVLLVFFWPLADTVLAIVRRLRSGKPTHQPDRLHFHQLVMRTLEISILGRSARHIANPLSTVVMIPMFVAPPMVGVLLWNQTTSAAFAFVFFSILFAVTYSVGMVWARASRTQSGGRLLYDAVVQRISAVVHMVL